MKKIKGTALLFLVLAIAVGAFAAATSNLDLARMPDKTEGWGTILNENFKKIDDNDGGAKGDKTSIAARLAVEMDTDGTMLARGTKDTLQERLNVSMNSNGTLKGTPEVTEWINSQHTGTYVSTTSFTILTDVTTIYTAGRRLDIYFSGADHYMTVVRSSYSSGTGLTTVTVDSAVIPSPMYGAQINYSVVQDNSAPRKISGEFITAINQYSPTNFQGSAVSYAIDMDAADIRSVNFTGTGGAFEFTVTNTPTTTEGTTKAVSIIFLNSGASTTLTFPGTWLWSGAKPANIADDTYAVLTIYNFYDYATTAMKIVASWSELGAGT